MFFRARTLAVAVAIALAAGSASAAEFVNKVNAEEVVRGFMHYVENIPSLDPYSTPSASVTIEHGVKIEATVAFDNELDTQRFRGLTVLVDGFWKYTFERTIFYDGGQEQIEGRLTQSVPIDLEADEWQTKNTVLESVVRDGRQLVDPDVAMLFDAIDDRIGCMTAIAELEKFLDDVRSGDTLYLCPDSPLVAQESWVDQPPAIQVDIPLFAVVSDPRPDWIGVDISGFPTDMNIGVHKNRYATNTGRVSVYRQYKYTWGDRYRTVTTSVFVRVSDGGVLNFRFPLDQVARVPGVYQPAHEAPRTPRDSVRVLASRIAEETLRHDPR